MKFFRTKILALLMVALFSFNAHSAIIALTPGDCFSGTCWTSLDNSNPDAADISALIGTTISDLLYKDDQGGSEGGSFAAFYSTEYFNEPTDPEDATVSWGMDSDSISCDGLGTSSCYLSILDGAHTPALYVFDISHWDGVMDIVLTDFWPDQGAISNLAIWGADGEGPCDPDQEDCGGGPQDIPEPGMLFLFASGLFGLAWSRRQITH